jgi:hypothetical protein
VKALDTAAVARDPGIPALARALDAEEAARWLEPHLTQRMAPGARVRLRALRPIRHKPGRRCLIEYELDRDRMGAETERIVVIGKARSRGIDHATVRLVEELWEGAFSSASADLVSVPEPLGAVPELGIWLQRKVPGAPATSLLGGPKGPTISRRIGEALHKLHQRGVPARRVHGLADELKILEQRLSSLAGDVPALSRRLEALLADCRRLAASVPAVPARGIHRDFYPDQVLVGEHGRLHLLDLDLYSEGDPALDAGNFLAHVAEQGLREGADRSTTAAVEDSFREKWLELAGEEKRWSVEVHTLLSLARHVSLSAGFLNRRPWTGAILELAERRVASLTSFSRDRRAEVAS